MTFFRRFQPAAALRATGSDAFVFLQGQFTNDLRLPINGISYGLWLNQKGKVLADSAILRISEQGFLVWSATSTASVIVARLEQYIIADDVTLEDLTAEVHAFAVWGDRSIELV